ncbi:hypothetical protein HDF09_000096 [Edaphobacter lichenicola]|uniref:Uncharacterized protein n=1 Tax=Tunturiibacter empetritectus TaxID=3069691 RepID=A0A7W8MP96_9BACT|nr:hypothetical protein [Edaphobacter lichenicola]
MSQDHPAKSHCVLKKCHIQVFHEKYRGSPGKSGYRKLRAFTPKLTHYHKDSQKYTSIIERVSYGR